MNAETGARINIADFHDLRFIDENSLLDSDKQNRPCLNCSAPYFRTLASLSDFADNCAVQKRDQKMADSSWHDVCELGGQVNPGVNKC